MSSPFVRRGQYASDDDYYVILGVDFYASQETIAHAYRQLAKKYHPDKHNQDTRSTKEARAIFDKIKRAYDVLGDQHKRKIYDTVGSDGLKRLEWQVTRRPMTDWDIKNEYERQQKLDEEKKSLIIAKPRAWLTIAIDASSIFKTLDRDTEDEYGYDDDDVDTIAGRLSDIQLTSMSASISGETSLSPEQSLTFSGDVNDKNGVGERGIGTKYVYRYSPTTRYDALCRIGTGSGSALVFGVDHDLNEKTCVNCQAIVGFSQDDLVPGAKITLTHKIRDYLIGKVSYSEGNKSSVSTSLIYFNKELALQVTTSYKLSSTSLGTSVELSRNFNNNQSKIHLTMGVSSTDGVTVAYGYDTRIFEINALGAALVLGVQSGITLKLRYNRGGHEFSVPIYLSDEVNSGPTFYGTMVPLVSYWILDRCWIRHHKRRM